MSKQQIFNTQLLNEIFPLDRTDLFFDALLGDASEGAYDIKLIFQGLDKNKLNFAFELHARPGKCLACNLTYGLPHVFERHPVINIKKVVEQIQKQIKDHANITKWSLGRTIQKTRDIHLIPLTVDLDNPININ